MKTLVVVPARGGSKGVKDKNIRLLGGKPLISYTLELIRHAFPDAMVCVSTDSERIAQVARDSGFPPPFLRPVELSTDTAGSYDVLVHALKHYQASGLEFECVVMMQPTSPFRRLEDIVEARHLFTHDLDMLVGVKETKANPYFTLFEESADGYLAKSKHLEGISRRQDAPSVYQYNGALYIISANSLRK